MRLLRTGRGLRLRACLQLLDLLAQGLFASPERFRLGKPEPAVATYTFYRHAVKHRFCPTCGIHVFAQGADAQGNPFVAVNIRCIDGLDLSAVTVREFDGRAL